MCAAKLVEGSSEGKKVILTRIVSENGDIAVISINKPETKNALGTSVLNGLKNCMEEIKIDSQIRAVILRSAAKHIFCAGGDLKERILLGEEEVSKTVGETNKLFRDFEELPQPTIAALDGAALGGGLELALTCDLRVAASNAVLGLVETRIGVIPGAGGTQRLPRIVGIALAKELIYTSRTLSAMDAKQINLVNHFVLQNTAGDAAYKRALELAHEILPNAPFAVRMAKIAISQGIQGDIDTGLCKEVTCYREIIPTEDRREGLKAFAEKRAPRFSGK